MPRQVKRTMNTFRNKKFKLMKSIQAIKFNKNCFTEKVIPNFINVKINNSSKSAQRAKRNCEIFWLKSEIRLHYKKTDMITKQLYQLHFELCNVIEPSRLTQFYDNVDAQVNKLKLEIESRHKKKVSELISNKNKSQSTNPATIPHKFYPRVVNKTDISFNSKELCLLNKGLKHNIAPRLNKKNIKNLIISTKIACATAKINQNTQNAIAHKANDIIKKHINESKFSKSTYNEQATLAHINKKLTNHEALIVKADKSSTAVIMYKQDYNNKTLEFFKANNITEIKTDPTQKYQDTLKKLLKNCNFLLTTNEAQYCVVMNPQAPRLRSQPKIHKDGCPIRPIVNAINSPGYKLTKKLHDILKKNYTFENSFSIKNRSELINSINDLTIPNSAIFASFDIVNLYTNIPWRETLLIIQKNLIKNKKLSKAEIFELLTLLELILSHNYFSFNGKFYMQNNGLAMGSSLAGLLANIFIDSLEQKFFKSHPQFTGKIIYYKRYVDDTIILFNGSKEELNNLAEEMNKMHPNIKFTVEHQTTEGINFLDMTISSQNNKHSFQIYRKSTTTDIAINSSSCHPNQHKTAFFRSAVNRMLHIPISKADADNEISILKSIAHNNGYNPTLVDTLYQKTKNKLNQPPLPLQAKKEIPKFACLPFLGTVSYKLANLFRPHNIKISFHTDNKLQHKIIHNNKPFEEWHQKSGIYKLTCSCSSFYVGQTGRPFATRYKEHMDALRLKNLNKSSFASHVAHHEHPIGDINDNLSILHIAEKGLHMDLLEQIEIYIHKLKLPDKILNEQTDSAHNFFFQNFQDILVPKQKEK